MKLDDAERAGVLPIGARVSGPLELGQDGVLGRGEGNLATGQLSKRSARQFRFAEGTILLDHEIDLEAAGEVDGVEQALQADRLTRCLLAHVELRFELANQSNHGGLVDFDDEVRVLCHPRDARQVSPTSRSSGSESIREWGNVLGQFADFFKDRLPNL